MSVAPNLEVYPPFENLKVSQDDAPAFQRFLTETDDNPEMSLASLSDTERRNIHVSFIIRAETETGLEELPSSLQGADYCFFDSPYNGTMRDRPAHDLVRNMAFDGRPVYDHRRSEDPHDAGRLMNATPFASNDPGLEAFVGSQHYQGRTQKPIVRTLGYGQYDHLPSLGLTSADTQKYIAPQRQAYQEGLFEAPNARQLELLQSIFALTAPELRDKNAQLRKDVSMMMAGAIRRHPDTFLQFAVVLNPRHDAAASQLAMSGSFVGMAYWRQRFSRLSQRALSLSTAYETAEQEAADAEDRLARPASMKRVVFSDYLYETYLDKAENPDLAFDYTRITNFHLQDEDISSLLDRLDDAKAARLPRINLRLLSPQERRRRVITELIWEHPTIASIRKAVPLINY